MAKDIFHSAVRKGLEKDGWLITDDPLRIQAGGADMEIDLGAEKIIAAERGEEKIAVEIKSFIGTSNISDFHTAVGQFINYRVALEERQPERILYLAVPVSVYRKFFMLPFVQTVIKRFQIILIIYDPVSEVLLEWKS
ncbi:XisH family protein [Plectonema cf. radiosum LEGE 06105]|uniref:XisH family protein n=1 Tax=Plectonema cf. radiosum LEGE 06105 TaxID=945769 RepID=A0A8J7F790_9CYAN|nr:XisH family protein [Plectonema radiosum]MBE9217003.1 XisH family protein [Plectonema cf. radiosum LEGE 06105]